MFSTWNCTDYGIESGTSMAAPHVGGVAAQYKAAHPEASPQEVKNWLPSSGSHYTDLCNFSTRGYLYGDPDGDDYPEPLLHAVISNVNPSTRTH